MTTNSAHINKWFAINGDNTLRLDYPLTDKSVVMDLGGFKGDFANCIYKKYNCFVYVYEPVKKFYLECAKKFVNNEKVKSFNYGLYSENGTFSISDENDASSIVKPNLNNCEQVQVKSFAEEFKQLNSPQIDLLKINIEGAEFSLLPHIFENNIISNINHIQIQFHTSFPEAESAREKIRSKLLETHEEKWNYPFVWESWSKKT